MKFNYQVVSICDHKFMEYPDIQWCVDRFGYMGSTQTKWTMMIGGELTFYFKNEDDYVEFSLRFG